MEKRINNRYPIRLTLKWKQYWHHHGLSFSLDMSSGGILIANGSKIQLGRPLRVELDWPVLLDGADTHAAGSGV